MIGGERYERKGRKNFNDNGNVNSQNVRTRKDVPAGAGRGDGAYEKAAADGSRKSGRGEQQRTAGGIKKYLQEERRMYSKMGIKAFQFKSIYLDLETGDFRINGQNIELGTITDFKLILGQAGWEIEVKQNALTPMYKDCSIPTLEVEEGN